MDWGLLGGIGDGLTKLGNRKMDQDEDKRKEELQQKLEKQREDRVQQRYDPSQDKPVQKDGLWYNVRYNKAGEEISKDLMPKNEIDAILREEKKAGLSDRLLTAQVSDTERKVSRGSVLDAREDEDWNRLTPEEKRQADRIKGGLATSAAQDQSNATSIQNAMTRSSGGSGSGGDQPTKTDYARSFVSDVPEATSEFVDSGLMTGNELLVLTKAAISRFAAVGKELNEEDILGYIRAAYQENPSKYGKKKGEAETPTIPTRRIDG